MGKLRNSALKNVHGEGHQKIYTDDNGNNYRIRNSALKNAHGDGYQQIVEKEGSSPDVPMGEAYSSNAVQIFVQSMSYNTTRTFDIYIIISYMPLFCRM